MLPPELASGVVQALSVVPTRQLTVAVEALSARYRGGAPAERAVQSESDRLAYLAARMPATYAALHAALAATAERSGDRRPRSLLDAGCGPGTAMWAACDVWPSLTECVLVDRDARMIAVGERLARAASRPAIRDARWQRLDLTAVVELPAADVVIAGYTLGELPAARRAAVIQQLWEACRDTLVVVEPGTPPGFVVVREVRDALLAAGAWTLAPCPHQHACPMTEGRWCHFAVRLERSRVHRASKRAALGYEDEKFSYVAMSRQPGSPTTARVIGHPRARHGGIDLDLCADDGLRQTTVWKRERERYQAARRARWGSAFLDRVLDMLDGDQAT